MPLHLRGRTELQPLVRGPPCDQRRGGAETPGWLQGTPSCLRPSPVAGNTEPSELQTLAALQAVIVAAAVVVAAVVAAAEDPFELVAILRTGLTLQRSGVLCRETGVWGTCEAGSRARGEERTAALCVGKVALGDGAIGLGEETGR